jgi:hypothetical protein
MDEKTTPPVKGPDEEDQILKGVSNEELRLFTIELNARLLRGDVDLIEERLQKLDEVYYHVFPERLAQDVKFMEQRNELLRSRRDNEDKTKS